MNAKDLRYLYNLPEQHELKGSDREELLFVDIMYRVKERASQGGRFLLVSGLFWHEGIHLMGKFEELGFKACSSANNHMYSILLKW